MSQKTEVAGGKHSLEGAPESVEPVKKKRSNLI